MPSPRRHRLAVVGLGMAVTPHAQSLRDLSARVDVAGAYSPTAERRASFAARFPFPVTDDLDALAADPSIEAAMILTPPRTHLPLVERFAAAGKHVLLEKPLEADTARAEAVVAACERGGVMLGVVLQHRFRPAARGLAARLRDGELGDVAAASVNVPWWRPQAYYDEPGRGTLARDGGGVLITQAIHTLDLFRWLVGIESIEAAQVRTTALHRMETEDYASALVRLGNGAPGTIIATVAAWPGSPEWLHITGSKGTARLEGGSLRLAFVDGREEVLADTAGSGSGANVMSFSHDAHRAVLSDFLDAIEQGCDPAIPGEEALATQRVIEAILNKGGR